MEFCSRSASLRDMRILLACLAVASVGCTTMNDSAPGPQPGSTFVVGSKQGRPAIWLCPEKSGGGECRWVEVDVDE